MRSKGVGGRARQASPRALAIGGGVALVIVIAIVLAVVLGSGGGGSSQVVSAGDLQGLPATGNANSQIALPGAPDANNLFKGIPQKGLVLGDPKAPVTMEMFIDVQCPVCQDYEVLHLPGVVKKYIADGKVQLHLQPWAFLGSQSFTGRYGVIAAADQNKGFEYAKVLYDNQGTEETGWLTGKEMAAIAASVNGLNLAQWMDDVNSSATKSAASTVDKLATQKNVTGTPTILVGPTGGKLQVATGGSGYNPTGVDQALAAAVANS
ncbi:MAG TPA: thioredoxin domain-containing protein [Gaiellaceae bacterium]